MGLPVGRHALTCQRDYGTDNAYFIKLLGLLVAMKEYRAMTSARFSAHSRCRAFS